MSANVEADDDGGSGLKADDFNMDSGTAGAAHTYPSEAGQIRKGGHIVIKGRPCKVVNVSTSKTGKHGHAKANFTAIDIFTGKKLEDIVPTSHTTYVPNVTRQEYTLLDITDEDFLSLMDENGESREDLKMPTFPEDLEPDIRKKHEENEGSVILTIMSAMGEEHVISAKIDTTADK